ncbi:MAG: TonB family C-terminal domain protein [Acidobacteria bacterium]|nr:TonB family C-terminal domain protein [Acidobacteriota bacterium]
MICNSCGNPMDSIHRFCPKCGAPVQLQSPAQPQQVPYTAPYTPPQYGAPPGMRGPGPLPPKKSFGCGKIILILVIILALLGAGIGAAIYYGYRAAEKALKTSEPYIMAVDALKQSSAVKERLGDIEETGFPLGAFSTDASGSGKAAFVMSVKGTKGTGQYQVDLTRTNSVWHINTAIVRTPDGHTIPVVGYRGVPDAPEAPDVNGNGNSNDAGAKGAIKGGVLNAKATSLPSPNYPAVAKAARASGTVVVQVLVDETGNVVSAHAISGHPLLRAAAEAAARNAKFTPTKLSGKPVKVSGTISYNFTPE